MGLSLVQIMEIYSILQSMDSSRPFLQVAQDKIIPYKHYSICQTVIKHSSPEDQMDYCIFMKKQNQKKLKIYMLRVIGNYH